MLAMRNLASTVLSKYELTMCKPIADHTKQTSSGRHGNVFELSRGDIVELLDETAQESLKADWMYGRLIRTGACGAFPFDCVYIIPTCEKPPEDFLVCMVLPHLTLISY